MEPVTIQPDAWETVAHEARHLREIIYGPISDGEWAKVELKWMDDIAWLRETAAKKKART